MTHLISVFSVYTKLETVSREGKRLLIYGLYWKDGDFFEKAYPAKAWEQPGLLHFSLKEQLMYLLLLYIAI